MRENWVVDPVARAVTVERFDGAPPVTRGPGERLETPLLPGFTLDLGRLFADARP